MKITNLIFLVLMVISKTLFSQEITIREIRISGNHYTLDNTILHYCEFEGGESYQSEELNQSIKKSEQKLFNTFYFYSVNIFRLQPGDSLSVTILIEVTEGFLWRFGGGDIYASIGKVNLFGKGKKVNIKAGLNIQEIVYRDDWLFDTPLMLKISAFHLVSENYEVENLSNLNENFTITRAGGSIGIGYQFGLDWEAMLNWQIAQPGFKSRNISVTRRKILGLDLTGIESILKSKITWDTRNRIDYPGSGYLLNIFSEFSGKWLGGDWDYQKYYFDLRKYFKLQNRNVIAAKILAGNSFGNVPYFQMFDINGMNGLRAPYGNHCVGNKMLALNLEYRFFLFNTSLFLGDWLEGILFTDIGRTWDKGENYTFKNQDYGFGPGIRLHFPMPVFVDVRLEYGFGSRGNKLYFNVIGGF